MSDTHSEKATGAENILWDLSIFYAGADDPQIDQDMAHLSHLVEDFEHRYKGQIANLSAQDFVGAMQALEAIYDLRGRIGTFAQLHYSTATNDPAWGALVQKITEFNARLGQKLVFFDLEWNDVPDEAAQRILDDPALGKFRYHLECERRFKPYQLSEPEEQILIDKNVTGRSAWTRFFTQLTSSLRFELDGEKLPMTQVLTRLYEKDRATRERAASALTAGLSERSMELTYIFNTLAADKASDDQRRGYESWITPRNLDNKAPDEVVEALISSVTGNYDLVARHYQLKKTLLGYDALYDYDRYAPLPLKESESFYVWDEAKRIVLDAFSAFEQRLGASAARFFDENWIHAPVLPDKRGGAFAHPSVPSAHPYVMVNYTGKANDVMTLAHELGHGVHMALAGEAQGLFGLYTPLTTAETASVFGEMLVFKDLMAKESDKEVQLMMLAEKIEGMIATVFRQVSMNRFEDAMHQARRTEGELSTERLSEIWMASQQAMFGDSVTMRDDYSLWWSYVPHFLHTPGYVYAYAFGELLVLALYRIYEEQGPSFAPSYVELLAAGDSDYPDKLLAKVGVDLNDPDFWNKGIAAIAELIDQEEALARELYPEKF